MADAHTLIEVLENGEGSHAAVVSPDGPTLTYDGLRRQVGRLMAIIAKCCKSVER